MTASLGGKLRVGPVGSPSRRAAAVSSDCPCGAPVPGAPARGVVSGRDETGLRGRGTAPWAASRPAPSPHSASSTIPARAAAWARRARRRVTTQAHQILTSYSSTSGTIISSIETASGGVSSAAARAAITRA